MKLRLLLTIAIVLAMSGIIALAQAAQPPAKQASKPPAKQAPKPPAKSTGPFVPGCTLPFASIETKGLSIDKICGKEGNVDPKAKPALAAQDLQKNNFCAGDPATAIAITPDTLAALQTAAEKAQVTFGDNDKLPMPRPLSNNFTVHGQTLHEGSLVRMSAFIIRGKFSDTSGGESVNCNQNGDPPNDIHIALGANYGADECTSVTAEISPHFRPKQWLGLGDVPDKAHATGSTPALAQNPIRVTGPIFFDAEHLPCVNGKAHGGSPARRSLWEIHPVYAVDVCTKNTLDACKADDNSVWKPAVAPATPSAAPATPAKKPGGK